MSEAFVILRHTPPWVYGVLAYLVWMGLRGLQARTFPFVRIWITPAVFLGLSVFGALARHRPPGLTALWLAGAALGAGPGLLTSPRHLEVDRASGRVRFRGSPFPLIRNLVIFVSQYALAVAAARGGGSGVTLWAVGVSGASAGYFLSWSAMFLARIRQAPEARLAPYAQPA